MPGFVSPKRGTLGLKLRALLNCIVLLLNQPLIRLGPLQCDLVLIDFIACGSLPGIQPL